MKPNNSSEQWAYYYSLISSLYDFIKISDCNILYQHKDSPFTWQGSIEPNYRAIMQLPKSTSINILEDRINNINETYALLNGSDKSLPQYIPRLLTDPTLSKIQIHENIAHASKNYSKDTEIPISVWSNVSPINNIEVEQNARKKELVYKMIQDLKANGYSPTIENNILYNELFIETNSLIEKFNCNSIQHRRKTGLQIRANFFTIKDGYLEKSKLSSVGVLFIPHDIEVSIFKSAKRKIRSDAIYHKEQSNEIILEEVPLSLKHGKHYAK